MIKLLGSLISVVVLVGCGPASSGSVGSGLDDFQDLRSPNSIPIVYENQLIGREVTGQNHRDLLFKNDPTVSYCEVNLDRMDRYSGIKDHQLYPIASISKVFLSAFAFERLGPDFKFVHEWSLLKNADGSHDAYFNSKGDPVFNIEKALYSMAKLRQNGVQRLRRLYISRQTRIYLSVLNNPHIELEQIPVSLDQSVDNLQLIFNSKNWGAQTEEAKVNVQNHFFQMGKSISIPNSFSVEQVIADPQGQRLVDFKNAQQIKIQSSSLFRYLKEINLNSNNYMSDALFAYLGGEAAFYKFQSEKLGLGTESLMMKTGSGLPVQINGQRVDNLSTCYAVLKGMHYIQLVAKQFQLDLGYILLTAGLDQGTYKTDLVVNKSVVLKTGRLFDVPTLNLSGLVSTKDGLMAFSFLGHRFINAQEKQMLQKRDRLLQDLIRVFEEKPLFKTLPQNEIFFL